jgi:Polyketide cyclase / dehydrase and lipid transport
MMEYSFVTVWHIEAPLEAVCEIICHSLTWPQWWHNVKSVEEITPGDARGIGSVRRYIWRGYLLYQLTFDIRVTHIEPKAVIEGIASGDVEGKGRWSFTADGAVTIVRHEWQVRTTPAWMNLMALFARPFFKWNHNAIMQQGGEALARMLNARLVEIAHY